MSIMRAFVFLTVACIIPLTSCKRAEQTNNEAIVGRSTLDTSANPPPPAAAENTGTMNIRPQRYDVIRYSGYWKTIQDPSNAFEPHAKLRAMVVAFTRRKDSLRAIGNDAFEKQEKIVYSAIMNYKRNVESGKYSQLPAVPLPDLPRTLGEEDSTFAFLPELQASFFSNGNFFFVGGAPFIEHHIEYDTATNQQIIFKDANQKSEQRFRVYDTENRYHILKSIMHYKKPKVSIDFGGPVYMSDLPADDVRGIGSVKHNFGKEVPVFFLMDSGVTQGHLKYFREPFTTQYPCYSDDTHLIFSCSPDIDVEQIIGIYIPYSDNGLTTCTISRPDRWSWTADLNNDTIPDIACVIDINNGPESGVMEMLWFANVNGVWKIIDYGLMPFCS